MSLIRYSVSTLQSQFDSHFSPDNVTREVFIRSVHTVTDSGAHLILIFTSEKMLVVHVDTNTIESHELPLILTGVELPTLVMRGPNKCIIFGGKSGDRLTNNLWEFNIAASSFIEIERWDDMWPIERYGHTAIYRSDSMFVYGGWDANGIFSNEFWEYNFLLSKWNKLEPPSCISGVFGHAAVLRKNLALQDEMIVCGGMIDFENFCQDMAEYNFSTKSWQLIQQSKGGWTPKLCRNTHEVQLTSNDCMIMFAGDLFENHSEKAANDMNLFRFSTQQWYPMVGSEEWKPCFGTASAYNPATRKLYMFWGEDENNGVHPCYEFQLPLEVTQISESCIIPEEKSIRCSHLSQLYNDALTTDFSLVSNEDKKFCVHKLILAMQSPYFMQLYKKGFEESGSACMKLEFFDSETTELLVRYMYGLQVYIPTVQHLVSLTTAANMLLMKELENQCAYLLSERVTAENVSPLKQVASTLSDTSGANVLKGKLESFPVKP